MLAIGSRLSACGVIGDLGVSVHSENFALVGTISRLLLPSDTFWRAAVFRLELAVLVAGIYGSAPFFATASPPAAAILWGPAWVVAMLTIACASFSARDV